MGSKQKPTKYDVQIEEARQTARVRIERIKGATAVFGIAATALPLYCVYLFGSAIAGKTTHLGVQTSMILSASIVVGPAVLGLVVHFRKSSQQRKELRRLRQRIQELEARIRELEATPSVGSHGA